MHPCPRRSDGIRRCELRLLRNVPEHGELVVRYNCGRTPAPTSPTAAKADVVEAADANGEQPGEIIPASLGSSPAPAVLCEREGTLTVEDDAAVDATGVAQRTARVPKARKSGVDTPPRSRTTARAAMEVGPDVLGGSSRSRGSPSLQPEEREYALGVVRSRPCAQPCEEKQGEGVEEEERMVTTGADADMATAAAATPPGLLLRTVDGKRIRTKNDLLQLTAEELAQWHARRAQLRAPRGGVEMRLAGRGGAETLRGREEAGVVQEVSEEEFQETEVLEEEKAEEFQETEVLEEEKAEAVAAGATPEEEEAATENVDQKTTDVWEAEEGMEGMNALEEEKAEVAAAAEAAAEDEEAAEAAAEREEESIEGRDAIDCTEDHFERSMEDHLDRSEEQHLIRSVEELQKSCGVADELLNAFLEAAEKPEAISQSFDSDDDECCAVDSSRQLAAAEDCVAGEDRAVTPEELQGNKGWREGACDLDAALRCHASPLQKARRPEDHPRRLRRASKAPARFSQDLELLRQSYFHKTKRACHRPALQL